MKTNEKMKKMLYKNIIVKESKTLDDEELAEKCDAIFSE